MQKTLNKLTSHVRETKGSGEALRFYVDFIQPIKQYFGGEAEVKKLNLQNVMLSCPKCEGKNIMQRSDGVIGCIDCSHSWRHEA